MLMLLGGVVVLVGVIIGCYTITGSGIHQRSYGKGDAPGAAKLTGESPLDSPWQMNEWSPRHPKRPRVAAARPTVRGSDHKSAPDNAKRQSPLVEWLGTAARQGVGSRGGDVPLDAALRSFDLSPSQGEGVKGNCGFSSRVVRWRSGGR